MTLVPRPETPRRILRAASAWMTVLLAVGAASALGTRPVAARIAGVNPASGAVEAGESTSATVSLSSSGGTSVLVADGTPPGASVRFEPQSGGNSWSSTMTVSTSTETPPRNYTITIRECGSTGCDQNVKHSHRWSLRVDAPPPPPAAPATTVAPTTTGAPTTTAAPTTTTPTEPPTTTAPPTTAAPTTSVEPAARFTTVDSLAGEALPRRVLFLPFASAAYNACLPLTGFCADPAGGVLLLPADRFEVTWKEGKGGPGMAGDDLASLVAVGVTPTDVDSWLELPVVRADGAVATVRRRVERGPRGRAELVDIGTQRVPRPRLVPEVTGPELDDPPPPPKGAPFALPVLLPAADLGEAVPVLVAVRGSVTAVYAIESADGWGLNHGLIPLLGGDSLPHLARTADGGVGLAVPVPAGLVVPAVVAAEPASDETGSFDIAGLAVPLAAVLSVLTGLIAMVRLVPFLRRRRRCECTLEHRWAGGELVVNWLGPTDRGRTHAARPFPLAASAQGFHLLNVTSGCNHKCGATPGPRSARRLALIADTEISWQILSGGGGFVAVEDTESSRSAQGEQVLLQPPELRLGEEHQVRLRVEAGHADPARPGQRRTDAIDVTVMLRRTAVGVLEIEVSAPPGRALAPPDRLEERGECPVTVAWKAGPLAAAIEPLPDGSFVAAGDHVRLRATGGGNSDLVLSSGTSDDDGHCVPVPDVLPLADTVVYEWSATAGSFPAGTSGSGVVFQAPDDAGEVTVTVVARPAAGEVEKEPVTLSMPLEVCALGVGIEKTPSGWLPDGRDGRLTVTGRTYRRSRGRWIAPGRRRLMTFRLDEVSAERGVCMNYPPAAVASRNPDLFFAESDNAAYTLDDDGTVDELCPTEIEAEGDNPPHRFHHQTAIGTEPVFADQVVVRCEDYGAFGHIVVEAPDCVGLTEGDSIDEGPAGEVVGRVTVPRDDSGNSIADATPHDAGGAPAGTDDDNAPSGDGTSGDGFTNYEEYRGFLVGGGTEGRRHVRTDPSRKDVFVHDEHNLGLGHFPASGLAVHILRDAALYDGSTSRVVNFNRGHATGGEQRGIRLVREHLAGPRQVAVGGPGTPGAVERVAIDTAAILAEGLDGMGDRARAHGLGHAVGIGHHGDRTKHFDCGPHTESDGGETSGDVECVMRYTDFAAGWCHDGHHRHDNSAPDVVGTGYCTSAAGTGSNDDNGHRNDASEGNCAGQLRVKDW